MNRIIALCLFIFMFNNCFTQTKSDTLYTVAHYYHEAYQKEGVHDSYIVRKIEGSYLKLLEIDPKHVKALYNIGVCYVNEAVYYRALENKKLSNFFKSRKYKKKAIKYFKKYTAITGQRVSVN